MPDNAIAGSTIKSLVNSLSLLKLFTPQRNVWTAEDMIAALGYHKSSVQRFLATLEKEGFLSKLAPRRSEYRLGPDILFLGSVAEMSLDLRSVARPIMADLVHRTRETCYLCVADQDQCLYIDLVECCHPVRIIHQVGQRNPLHCTGVGKVLMSGMADEIIDRLIETRGLKAHTRCTITDRSQLKQEIDREGPPHRCGTTPGRWWRPSASRAPSSVLPPRRPEGSKRKSGKRPWRYRGRWGSIRRFGLPDNKLLTVVTDPK